MRVQVKVLQILVGTGGPRAWLYILFHEALGFLRGASQIRYREVRKSLERTGFVPQVGPEDLK